jgi:hypothetical protein
MPEIRETGPRYKTHISRPDHRYAHENPLLKNGDRLSVPGARSKQAGPRRLRNKKAADKRPLFAPLTDPLPKRPDRMRLWLSERTDIVAGGTVAENQQESGHVNSPIARIAAPGA